MCLICSPMVPLALPNTHRSRSMFTHALAWVSPQYSTPPRFAIRRHWQQVAETHSQSAASLPLNNQLSGEALHPCSHAHCEARHAYRILCRYLIGYAHAVHTNHGPGFLCACGAEGAIEVRRNHWHSTIWLSIFPSVFFRAGVMSLVQMSRSDNCLLLTFHHHS
jgi:hypothetical protein